MNSFRFTKNIFIILLLTMVFLSFSIYIRRCLLSRIVSVNLCQPVDTIKLTEDDSQVVGEKQNKSENNGFVVPAISIGYYQDNNY